MLKLDNKKKNWLIIAVFAVYCFYIYFNYNFLAGLVARDGITGYLIYFLTNPQYVAIMLFFAFRRTDNKFNSILAGILIVIAFDAVSTPHCVPILQNATIQAENAICSDTLTIHNFISLGIPYKTAHFFYYVLMPILLLLVALKLVGHDGFRRQTEGIGNVGK